MRKVMMNGVRLTGLAALAAQFMAGNGAILMLHRVGAKPQKSGINNFLSVDPEFLDELLTELKQSGLKFVSMDEFIDRLKYRYHDERFATVTLDDGYKDNLEKAAPIFRKHDVPFMIYACTGFVDGHSFLWWQILGEIIDQNPSIAVPMGHGQQVFECDGRYAKNRTYNRLMDHLTTDLDEYAQRELVTALAKEHGIDPVEHCQEAIMSWDEFRKIADDPLCTIGAHTLNHYHIARLDRDVALEECKKSADILEKRLGKRPEHLAFPYGGPIAVGNREPELAKEAGFVSAVTTRHGLIQPEHVDHMHALPRVSVNGSFQEVHYLKTLLTGAMVPMANRGKKIVTV